MSANETKVESLVLEHLRYLRASVDRIETDVREVKHRIARLEEQTAGLHQDFAGVSMRIDRMDERVRQIEKRLELAA